MDACNVAINAMKDVSLGMDIHASKATDDKSNAVEVCVHLLQYAADDCVFKERREDRGQRRHGFNGITSRD